MALVAATIGMGGLAACSESAGPEAGGVTVDDLQEIEDDLGALEERVGLLEENVGEPGVPVDPIPEENPAEGIFEDPEPLIGQEVTVSAEVSELFTLAADIGSAFRIAGESGEPISVISAMPPVELDADDVVQVSGTVVQVQRDTFETDFGIAAEELFEDPEAFFAEEEGGVAIAANRIEVLQEQAD